MKNGYVLAQQTSLLHERVPVTSPVHHNDAQELECNQRQGNPHEGQLVASKDCCNDLSCSLLWIFLLREIISVSTLRMLLFFCFACRVISPATMHHKTCLLWSAYLVHSARQNLIRQVLWPSVRFFGMQRAQTFLQSSQTWRMLCALPSERVLLSSVIPAKAICMTYFVIRSRYAWVSGSLLVVNVCPYVFANIALYPHWLPWHYTWSL